MTDRPKRRIYLINPKFQLRFMAYMAIALVLGLSALYFSNSYYYDVLVSEGQELGLESDHPYYVFIDDQRELLTKVYLVVSSIVFVSLMGFGLFLSHRIAGPLYHISKVIAAVREAGGESALVKLRKSDFFPEMEDVINQMIIHYRKQVGEKERESIEYLRNVNAVKAIAGARVLVVEDNEVNRELLNELLNSNGVSTIAVEHGQEALDLLSADPEFDGILMDGQMPVLDGFDTTRLLRSLDGFKHMPIIGMTANLMDSDRQRGLDAGMNDHVGKPIVVSELFMKLAEWIKPAQPFYREGRVIEELTFAIPVIEGVDVQQGLARTQDNPQLYLRLLKRFVEGQQNFAARFEATRDDGEAISGEREAHTLKGVAANIGIYQIQVQAEALERACRNNRPQDEIDQIRLALTSRLEQIISNIEEAIASIETSAAETAGDAASINQLRTLLQENDTSAMELIEALMARNPAMNSHLQQIADAVAKYDFDEALRLCDEIGL